MEEINFSTGVTEFTVNGGPIVRFNPSDIGFVENFYCLLAKIDAIDAETAKKKEKAKDPAKIFDYARAVEKRKREAIDSVFGDGFCSEAFKDVRLVAADDGLTAFERFVFAVMDKIDERVMDNMSKRESRIAEYTAKYTAKYQKYRK